MAGRHSNNIKERPGFKTRGWGVGNRPKEYKKKRPAPIMVASGNRRFANRSWGRNICKKKTGLHELSRRKPLKLNANMGNRKKAIILDWPQGGGLLEGETEGERDRRGIFVGGKIERIL